MYCPNCGKELKEGAKFCGECGTRISLWGSNVDVAASEMGRQGNPVPITISPAEDRAHEGNAAQEKTVAGTGREAHEAAARESDPHASKEAVHDSKGGFTEVGAEGNSTPKTGGGDSRDRKKFIVILLIALAVTLVIVMVNAVSCGSSSQFDQLIDTGNRYLTEMDYEQAIVVFDSAIAIEPKKAAGYVGKATAQYYLARYEEAQDTIYEGLEMAEDDTSELEELLILVQEAIAEAGTSDTSLIGDADSTSGGSSASSDQDSVSEESTAEAGQTEAEAEAEVEEASVDYGYVAAKETGGNTILLNYDEIRVAPNTGDYAFQLEVLNAEEDEEYTWELSGDAADETSKQQWAITDDGLLTFTTDMGVSDGAAHLVIGMVIVSRTRIEDGRTSVDSRTLYIYISDTEEPGYEVRILTEDSNNQPHIYRFDLSDDGEATLDYLSSYVYYSGDVEIPDQLEFDGVAYEVTAMDPWALKWSSDMETLYIPSGLTSMTTYVLDTNPFLYADNLREITVAEDNEAFMSIDGVLYSKDGTTLYCYPAGREAETFTLPAEVEYIASGAFRNCSCLKEILVEEGNAYFASIDGALVNISTHTLEVYPAGKEDAEYAIPDDVTSVDEYAFYGSLFQILHTGGLSQLELEECPNLERVVCGSALKSLDLRRLEREIAIESGDGLTSLTIYAEHPADLSLLSGLTGVEQLKIWFGDTGDLDIKSLMQLSNMGVLNLTYLYRELYESISESDVAAGTTVDTLVEVMTEEIQEAISESLPDCQVTVGYYWG